MKRWKTSTALMLGLLVGGVMVNQTNNVLADSASTIADNIQAESKFNDWENSLDAMSVQAYNAETGEDLTAKLDKGKLTDDKLLFNSARKANAVFGYHDKMTDDEATKYSDQLLDNYLTKDGFMKVSNSNVQTYKSNAAIKGYTLIFVRAKTGENTKFYYVPNRDASKYQSFEQIAKLDKGDSLLTFIGKSKDDSGFQFFKVLTTPLLTQKMQLLYNGGVPQVPGAKSDSFPDSGSSEDSSSAVDSSSSDSSSATRSSSSSADSDSASDLPNVNSSEKAQASEAASQAISQLFPATTGGNSDTQASNASNDDGDSDLSPATSDDDANDTNSPSDNVQANRNSTATNPSASSSSQPAQTASSVANSQNNQTLPQTGNDVKANLIFAVSGGIVALTGAYIITKRKNVR